MRITLDMVRLQPSVSVLGRDSDYLLPAQSESRSISAKMAASSPISPHGLTMDRSQVLSHLFDTIDDFERTLKDELPKHLFPRQKHSNRTQSIPREDAVVVRKRKHEREKRQTEDEDKDRLQARSVSPLLYFLTEEALPIADRVTPEPERIVPNRFLPSPFEHLGPGSYNVPKPRLTKESFSVLPRFPLLDTTGKAPFHPQARIITPIQKKEVMMRIRRNIESIDLYKPGNFKLKLKEKAVKEDFRANVCRLARKEIEESQKRRYTDDINEKFRRYDWRLRAEEISECKRRWVAIVYYLGSVHYWYRKQAKRKVRRRQILHLRSQNILKFLLLIAISVGKISRIVRQKRYKRAIVIIKRLAPFAAKWMRRRKMHMRESIAETIETSISMDIFYKIIATWKRRIVMIQRTVGSWLQRRRAYKAFLLQCWNVKEAKLPAKVRPAEFPPEAVKIVFLNDFLKSRMKAHLYDIENWKAKCESIQEHYEKLVYDMIDDPPPPPAFPRKPTFPTFLSSEEVLRLLYQAEKKKSRWQRIIKDNRKVPHRKESLIESGPD